MSKYTLFVSDLHLSEHSQTSVEMFCKILEDNVVQKTEAIYILGDLFNVWIGDDYSPLYIAKIKAALKKISDCNISLFIMPGNHDFLLGQKFVQEIGAQLLVDPVKISLYGIPTLLSHGDIFCTNDKKYIWLHKFLRHSFCQKTFLMLPVFLRAKLADTVCRVTSKAKKNKPTAIKSVVNATILSYLQKHVAVQVIYGHTHQHKVRKLEQNGKEYQCIALDCWENAPYALCYSETGEITKIIF